MRKKMVLGSVLACVVMASVGCEDKSSGDSKPSVTANKSNITGKKCKITAQKQVGVLFMYLSSCGTSERLLVALPLQVSYNKPVLRAAAVEALSFVREQLGKDAMIGDPVPGVERVITVNKINMKVLAFYIKFRSSPR